MHQPFKNPPLATWGPDLHSELVSLRSMPLVFRISRAKWPLLALFVGLALGAAIAFPFSVDDAYITARYARNLAQGLGYAFNPGFPSDGVTGPLWLLPLVSAVRLGCDALQAAKWCGLFCALAAGACCVLRAQRRAQGSALAWSTALLIASSLSLTVWAVAGLETGAATLAFTGMALATTAKRTPRGLWLGVSIACAAWLRPELSVAAGACIVCTFARSRVDALRAFTIACASVSLLLGFRYALFRDCLSLSAYAKPPELEHGLVYLRDALRAIDVWLLLVLAIFAVHAGTREDRAHAFILGAHVLACVLAGGDWMPGLRLFAPMVPIAGLLVAAGVRTLPRYRIGTVLLALALLFRLGWLSRELPSVRLAGENRTRSVPQLADQLASKSGTVLALDIGALGYLTNRPMLDLGGLVEPTVAHARGGHLDKKVDEHWVERNMPAWIVLHSATKPQVSADGQLLRLLAYPVEQRVARMSFVRSHYRVTHVQHYSDAYYYVILGLRADPAGPDFAR